MVSSVDCDLNFVCWMMNFTELKFGVVICGTKFTNQQKVLLLFGPKCNISVNSIQLKSINEGNKSTVLRITFTTKTEILPNEDLRQDFVVIFLLLVPSE